MTAIKNWKEKEIYKVKKNKGEYNYLRKKKRQKQ